MVPNFARSHKLLHGHKLRLDVLRGATSAHSSGCGKFTVVDKINCQTHSIKIHSKRIHTSGTRQRQRTRYKCKEILIIKKKTLISTQ